MKGQMFVVTMIFLVGLIFFVQQALFGYISFDLTEPFQEDDYYVKQDIRYAVDEIIGMSSTCPEANEKIYEFIDFVKREVVKRGYELENDYLLDCSEPFPPVPVCGDYVCEGNETCGTCETDCGVCPPVCGDGTCDAGECSSGCAADCTLNDCCGIEGLNPLIGEVCDGANLGEETCQTQGYGSGDLACSLDCMSFDTSDCVFGAEITGCTNITAPGLYYLENDMIDSSSPYCMNISANNVILDCHGKMIDGNDVAGYGIYVYRSSNEDTNITIRDCIVSDWDTTGIYFYRADNNTVINVNVTSNTDRGIRTYRSSYNNFTDCKINDNGREGIYLTTYSDYNTFTDCTVNNSGREGVYIDSNSDYNTFTDCTVNNNAQEGVNIRSDYNNFTNCKINNNEREGVDVMGDYNTFTDCSVNNNEDEGMTVSGEGNKIINTRLLNNTEIDYWDINSVCDSELINVTGTDNKPIVYYNETVIIRDWDNNVSEIILCNADNSVIDNVTLNRIDRQNNAILLLYTDNTTMTDVDIINSRYGIYLRSSQNNIISNCYAGDNIYGIYLIIGEGNNITGCNFTDNNWGIYLVGTGTVNNTITNSYFTDNNDGLRINYASNNTIYNNFFNNTDNLYFYTPAYNNTWNTTLTSGTNIIGGSWIGGNYWANPGGTGFSETCTDTSPADGICDNAYNVTTDTGCTPGVDCGNNADYLPLK